LKASGAEPEAAWSGAPPAGAFCDPAAASKRDPSNAPDAASKVRRFIPIARRFLFVGVISSLESIENALQAAIAMVPTEWVEPTQPSGY
jgi:hypothetical protein